MNEIRYPVAVFAHNEEASIIPCLQSLEGAALLDIFVLANGCTDNTVDIVKAYSHTHSNVTLIEIAVGDKSNAWNLFIHKYAPKHSDVYFFIDGDVRADQNALNRLSQTLLNDFGAHIAAAVPGSGRNRISQTRMQAETHGVHGNLYAAKGSFIASVRSASFRIPIGFVREDGLIGAMAKWDLSPFSNPWNQGRIAVVPEARFIFDSIRIFSIREMKKYWNRRIRYSIGHFETSLLRESMKLHGISGITNDVVELYSKFEVPELRWRGLDTLFDWIALRRIKRSRKNIPS